MKLFRALAAWFYPEPTAPAPTPAPTFRCSGCGGSHIQCQTWAYPNEGYRVSESDRGEWAVEQVWCLDCRNHVDVVEL